MTYVSPLSVLLVLLIVLGHRRTRISMRAVLRVNFKVINVITISLNHNPVLAVMFIVLFECFFTISHIYGNRANSVGHFCFIFIDSKASFEVSGSTVYYLPLVATL